MDNYEKLKSQLADLVCSAARKETVKDGFDTLVADYVGAKVHDAFEIALNSAKEVTDKYIAWLEKQGDKIVDCPQNHQDVNHPNGGIVMVDFSGGEGFYKLHLDYLNKKQVEEVEEMVRMWNKESKTSDENIKNCIGMCLTDANEQRFKNYGTNLKDCLAWLEKQGEQKSAIIIPKFRIGDEIKTSNKESLTITKIDEKGYWSEDLFICSFEDSAKWELVEKLVDKFEPKFKVGDWIILPLGTIAHIDSLISTDYQLITTDGKICDFRILTQDCYRLWEITDAKDGDVLVASDGSIFLFAGVDDCACKYYVALTTDNYVNINKDSEGGYWETSRAVHPATKEQRDSLFKKMEEAGWEWDAENKRLTKK